jgi:hypothetical protein
VLLGAAFVSARLGHAQAVHCGRPWHRLGRVLVRRYEGRDEGSWLAVSRV